MSQTTDRDDPLLAYCIALGAADFDRGAAIWLRAETEAGLEAAILALHRRFDAHEDFAAQLLRERASYQETH